MRPTLDPQTRLKHSDLVECPSIVRVSKLALGYSVTRQTPGIDPQGLFELSCNFVDRQNGGKV